VFASVFPVFAAAFPSSEEQHLGGGGVAAAALGSGAPSGAPRGARRGGAAPEQVHQSMGTK